MSATFTFLNCPIWEFWWKVSPSLWPHFEIWGTAAGDTDLEDSTCRPRKVPAALWWHFCETVCSLASSPYPAHIIKHLQSHKNLLLLIVWKMYNTSDNVASACPPAEMFLLIWHGERPSVLNHLCWQSKLNQRMEWFVIELIPLHNL